MKAIIKSIDNIEIDDLIKWKPIDVLDFAIHYELLIGPDDSIGEEIFSLTVCTLEWFIKFINRTPNEKEKGFLIVANYDYCAIVEILTDIVNSCKADNWNEISKELSNYFNYEFDNYIGFKK